MGFRFRKRRWPLSKIIVTQSIFWEAWDYEILWRGRDSFHTGEHIEERNLKQNERKLLPTPIPEVHWDGHLVDAGWRTGWFLPSGNKFSNHPVLGTTRDTSGQKSLWSSAVQRNWYLFPLRRWGNGCTGRLSIGPKDICHLDFSLRWSWWAKSRFIPLASVFPYGKITLIMAYKLPRTQETSKTTLPNDPQVSKVRRLSQMP